jgi:hypothetical protein
VKSVAKDMKKIVGFVQKILSTEIRFGRSTSKKKNEHDSGKIWIENGIIYYLWDMMKTRWKIPINKIKIIAEYTNQDGPFFDDYFLVFAISSEEQLTASFYAEGRGAVLVELGKILNVELKFSLLNSADFKSCVMWPPDLSGEEFLEFYILPPKSFIGRITRKLIGVWCNYQRLAPKIKSYLQKTD